MLGQSDLVLALVKLGIEREKVVARLHNRTREESGRRPLSLGKMIHDLTRQEILPAGLSGPIREVVSICNRAAHGEEIRDSDSTAVLHVGTSLLERLYWFSGNLQIAGRRAQELVPQVRFMMKYRSLIAGGALCGVAIVTALIASNFLAEAKLEVLSVGREKDEWTPISIRLSPGPFSKWYIRTEVNGMQNYYASSTGGKAEIVVPVLTGVRGGNPTAQNMRRAEVLYTVRAGDVLKFDHCQTEIKLSECIDNLNQHRVHYAGVGESVDP